MSLRYDPALTIPAPLRASEIPSFTHYSVVTRLPEIGRRTLAENDFPQPTVEAIHALMDEISSGTIRAVDTPLAPDREQWDAWIKPYIGLSWLDVPWFFAEEYFYRRILEATRYFTDGYGYHRDPYAAQKKLGLRSMRPQIRALVENTVKSLASTPVSSLDTLERLLLVDLWGNQNDLSMWPVPSSGKQSTGDAVPVNLHASAEHILANDLSPFMAWIARLKGSQRVDILLDNAGYELVTDLVLADFLINSRWAACVTLHAKTYPVFVSDATQWDIHDTLDALFFDQHPDVKSLAIRLRSYLIDDRLVIQQHPFWTSPEPMWEMPVPLAETLSETALFIAKGDANYRRLLGDRHWETDLPFSSVVDYLPCAVLALRTLKSEIVVGIDPECVPASDPNWMINGRWGLIEFAPLK